MEGHGKWFLIGRLFALGSDRLFVLGSEVPKGKGMAYPQSIPRAESGWKNPGECQSLLLEITWWPWLMVLRIGS